MARLQAAKPRGLDPVRRLTYAFAKRLYGRRLEPTVLALDWTFGIKGEGFSGGMYCVVPDGSANLNSHAAQQVESVGRGS